MWSSWLFRKVEFFLPQTMQFDKGINLFSLFFLTFKFLFSVYYITFDTIGFHCFYIIYSTEGSISPFISLYSLNTLFTETNLSWRIYGSIKYLEIRTSIVFNLPFHNNIILSYFSSFNSCSDCKNVYSYCRTRNTYRNIK